MSATASTNMPSYLPGDTLRFYPRGFSNHYTAIVLKDGSIMGVPQRTIYPTIGHWGMMLPEWHANEVLVNRTGTNPEYTPAKAAAMEESIPAAPLKKKVQSSQYLYPYKTVLRYYLDDLKKHVTAIVLSADHIMQVKPNKESFDSVDEWLKFVSDQQKTGEEIYEEDLTAEVPGHAEYPILKLDEKILPRRPVEADDVEKTLTATFDGMHIEITGPLNKAKRSLDAIFQAMQI
jgi:hypothetical protein